MVWLIFDDAVFGGVKRSIFLLMAPEVVGEILWGYRNSHLRLQAFNLTVTQLAPYARAQLT